MRAFRPVVVLAAVLAATAPAMAGDEVSRLRESLRRVTVEMRDLEDANEGLRAKQAEYERKLQDLSTQVTARDKEAEALRGRIGESAASERRARLLADQVRQDQAAMAKLSDAYRTLSEAARSEEAGHKKAQGLYEQADAALATCQQKNKALYDVGIEIIDRFQDRSFLTTLLENEPFTGKARVQLENLAQDYEDKLREQRIVTDGQ